MAEGGEQGWFAYLALIVSLFAIMNPLYSISTFLSLSEDLPDKQRRAVPFRTAFASFVIMMIAFFAGESILRLFSLSLPSLRISGGLVVFATGWSMVRGHMGKVKAENGGEGDRKVSRSIAVIPLAMPLTSGPGAISLMIVVATYGNEWEGQLAIAFAVFLICCSVWWTLRMAERIRSVVGTNGLDVVGRFMGLILLALSIEFITGGLAEKFPGWL